MKLYGDCEVFNSGKCLGCEALATNKINYTKYQCETYQKLKKGNNKHGIR
jgi:hypothetical protein